MKRIACLLFLLAALAACGNKGPLVLPEPAAPPAPAAPPPAPEPAQPPAGTPATGSGTPARR